MPNPEYPLNYNFWEEDEHYQAVFHPIGNHKPDEEVTVVGNEDVITNYHGYDIPDGFLLFRDEQGNIRAIHQRWIERK